MIERLRDVFPHGWDTPIEEMFLRLGVAFLLGCGVAGVCWAAHRRDKTLSPTFLTTLVMLSILIALLTQVIGDNLARAFSLAGVLAIVRFRTIVEDSRDTAFVIFSVIEGMAVGGGYLVLALVGLCVGGAAAFIVRPRLLGFSNPWTLTVRIGLSTPPSTVESAMANYLTSWDQIGCSTSRQGAAIEITYRVRPSSTLSSPAKLVSELNEIEGIQNVELKRS